MTKEFPPLPVDNLPEPVVKSPLFNVSLIWLVPVLAALVGLSLVIHGWLQTGPNITIAFQSAEGLEAGKTPVKYRNVVIGKVTTIQLSRDHSHVLANVALSKNAESFATSDTRYWVVQPRIGLAGISGVDTLLSGAFIGVDGGHSQEFQDKFNGLETPPAVLHDAPGKVFILHSDNLGSLDIGSPVYYRRIKVGRVASYQLDKDGKGVSIQIFIDGPNDKFITESSRFWVVSGVQMSVGTDGVKVSSQSLEAVLAGGVAFQDPAGPHNSMPALENASFTLFDDQATAMGPPNGPPRYFRMYFDQTARGLAVDAPVELLGINIGHVVSTNLDYDAKRQRFLVRVGAIMYPQRLDHSFESSATMAPLRKDGTELSHMLSVLVQNGLRAQARSDNLLTGQLYIALDFVPKARKVAFNPSTYPLEIPTVPGNLAKLQEQLVEIVDKVQRIPFDSIGKNLDQTLGEVKISSKDFDRAIDEVNHTLQQVRGRVLPEFQSTLEDTQQALRTANNVLSGDSPLQQQLGDTLNELQRLARSLRVLTDYLSRNPESLIRGRQADPSPTNSASSVPAKSPEQGSKP